MAEEKQRFGCCDTPYKTTCGGQALIEGIMMQGPEKRYENGLELTVENVRKQPRHHPRCGTSFLFVVILISIILSVAIFTPLEISNVWLRMLLHLLLLPLIMGITYEFNRYVGAHEDIVSRILRAPGLWMQNFTTFEPDDSMIEVAIEALKQVLPEEKGSDRW